MTFFYYWRQPSTLIRALKVASIVGTILTTVNHGDIIWAGNWPALWKIVITYCVPFCVSSYSSAATLSKIARTHRPFHSQ